MQHFRCPVTHKTVAGVSVPYTQERPYVKLRRGEIFYGICIIEAEPFFYSFWQLKLASNRFHNVHHVYGAKQIKNTRTPRYEHLHFFKICKSSLIYAYYDDYELTIEGKNIVDDIIFDIMERASWGSVICVSESTFSERGIEFHIATNDLRAQPAKFFLRRIANWHAHLWNPERFRVMTGIFFWLWATIGRRNGTTATSSIVILRACVLATRRLSQHNNLLKLHEN